MYAGQGVAMSRSFDAAELVVLPILDVSSAISLGGEVLTAAKSADDHHKLPKSIKKSLSALAEQHQSLRTASAERLGAAQAVDGTRSVRADRRIDAAWSALSTWLTGWAKLPTTLPQQQQAQAILDDIFSTGLKFLTLSYKQEWAESDTRLLRISTEKHDATLTQLGGAAFLDELRAAHAEYGEALGITKTPETPDAGANLRDRLKAFQQALRTYVVRVTAHVDDDDAASNELATLLLAPLARWETTPRAHADKNDPVSPTSEAGATECENAELDGRIGPCNARLPSSP